MRPDPHVGVQRIQEVAPLGRGETGEVARHPPRPINRPLQVFLLAAPRPVVLRRTLPLGLELPTLGR